MPLHQVDVDPLTLAHIMLHLTTINVLAKLAIERRRLRWFHMSIAVYLFAIALVLASGGHLFLLGDLLMSIGAGGMMINGIYSLYSEGRRIPWAKTQDD